MKNVSRFSLLAIIFLNLSVYTALADIELGNLPEAVESVSLGGSTEQYYLAHRNAFGVDGEDYQWVDAMFKLHTQVNFKAGIEMKVGMIYAGTFGKDYYSSPYSLGALPVAYEGNDNSKFEADEAYLKFNSTGGLPVDLTFGKQRINIEKGFLVSEQDWRFDANVYGNGAKASPFAVRADLNLAPVTATLYGARVNTDDQMSAYLTGDSVNVYGLNLHYAPKETAYLYAGLIHYTAKTEGAFDTADTTAYLGADVTFGGLNFQAEFAAQSGKDDINHVDRDASAGMAFIKYTFEPVSMTPFVEAGGWFFSGDDPDTGDNEAFNTMTIGFPDWGKWLPGEIFGEQLYFGASDYQALSLQTGLYPTAATSIRMQYFNVSWLETETVYGAYQVGDEAASDELNLILEWYPTDAFYSGIIAGMAFPDTGVETLNGDDETASMLMFFWSYSF